MEQEHEFDESKPDKKHRKRMKAIHSKILKQMEFYFSDSNLFRDRFLKQEMDRSDGGWINISTFMKFNRIRSLSVTEGDIAKALRKSKLLQVNEEKTQIKRSRPPEKPQDVDERTIYVECLPSDVDHEWISRIFSPCGEISYVSIPKYKSSGEPKGFAFIEFTTVAAAEAACNQLNNPPAHLDYKPTKFPKSNKQMDQLKRKTSHIGDEDQLGHDNASHDKGDEDTPQITDTSKRKRQSDESSDCAEDKTSASHSAVESKKKKRTRQTSESSVDGEIISSKRKKSDSCSDHVDVSVESKSEQTDSNTKKNKRTRQTSESSVDGEIISSKCKKSDSCSDHVDVSVESKSEQTDSNTEKCKTDNMKKKKKKRKSRSSLEKGLADESESETADDKKDKKRKRSNLESTSEDVVKKKKVKLEAKKRTRLRKHKQRDRHIPELKVVPKKEWLLYREEYLSLQKESMSKLKKSLQKIQEDNKKEEDSKSNNSILPNKEVAKENKPVIEYTPNVIVRVTSSESMFRKQLKEDVGVGIEIAYIDLLEGNNEAVVRCKNSESADKLVKHNSKMYNFHLLQDEDEKTYWDKLASDREAKFSKKDKTKKKGSTKLVSRAQKVNVSGGSKGKHTKFNDD